MRKPPKAKKFSMTNLSCVFAKKMHLLDAIEAQAVHFFQHEERITLSLPAEAQSKLSAFGLLYQL